MVGKRWVNACVLVVLGCGPAAEEVAPGGDSSSSGSSFGDDTTLPGPSTAGPGSTGDTSGGTSSSGGNGTTGDSSTTDDSTSTGDPSESGNPTGSTGATAGCTLPVLIHDSFDNGDPATGGPGAIDGGVVYDDNNVTDGTLVEENGVARVTTSFGASLGATPNVGLRTVASFDGTLSEGVTTVAVIESADAPTWQGIVLALHRNDGFYELSGAPGLEVHVFGSPATGGADNEDSVVLIAESSAGYIYSDQSYDPPTVNDGFVLAVAADPAGWRVRAEGLTSDNSPLTASGTWEPGFAYADILDGDSFATVGTQGLGSDVAGRTVEVASLTVYAGVCDDDELPEPS